MPLYTPPNLTEGLDDALYSVAHSVPAFPIMILVFTFFVILIGGSTSQKRRIGNPDIPFWAILSGIATTLLALVMTIPPGMIDITTLGIVIAITILCGLWFFLSKVKGEQ